MASITPSYDREGEHIGWQVSVRKKGFPAHYKTFRTKVEAQEWASIIESEIVRGVWRDRSRAEALTVSDLLSRYQQEILPDKKSPGARVRNPYIDGLRDRQTFAGSVDTGSGGDLQGPTAQDGQPENRTYCCQSDRKARNRPAFPGHYARHEGMGYSSAAWESVFANQNAHTIHSAGSPPSR